MRRLYYFWMPFALLSLLLAAGCMTPEEKMVGKWRGKVEMGQSMKSTLNASPMGAMAGNIASMIDPQLDLRPDKTFTLSLSMAPIDGTWKLDQNEITLTP